MANAIILGSGGGGTSSDELSATGADVRTGKTYVGQDTNDEIGTGTMPEKVAQTYEPKTTVQTIPANQYLTGVQTISAVSQTNLTAANIKTGVTITVKGGNTNIYSVAGTFCSDATLANNNQMLSGNIAYGKNGAKYTGSIVSMAGKTITPTTARQSVGCASKYMTSDVVVNGDANFVAANIKKGVKIWGVTGTWEGYVPVGVLDIYNHGTLASGWSIGGAVAMADSIIVTSRDVRVNFLTAPSINLAITAAMTYLNIEFELMESVAYNYAILSLHTTSNSYLYYTAFGSTVEQESENYSYGTTVCYKKQALVVGVPTVIQIPLKYARTTLDKPYMTFAGGKNTSDYIIKVTHIWIS